MAAASNSQVLKWVHVDQMERRKAKKVQVVLLKEPHVTANYVPLNLLVMIRDAYDSL